MAKILDVIRGIRVWHLILSLIAIVGIIAFASCGQAKSDEGKDMVNDWEITTNPMKLMAVCSPTPAQMVSCTWIPLEEKHRTEAEQKLYKKRN